MIRTWFRSSWLWMGVLSLSLSGCADGGGVCGGGKYWESDGIRTIGEGAAIGAVVGGLAGGLGSRGNAGLTALSAAGGALIGTGIGCAVNASKSAFAAKEDTYDRRLSEMQRLNDDLLAKTSELQMEQSRLSASIDNLRSQEQYEQLRQAQTSALSRDAHKKLETARQLAAAAERDLQKEEGMVADAQTKLGWASEQAAKLRAERDATRNLVAELNAQVNSLSASTDQVNTL